MENTNASMVEPFLEDNTIEVVDSLVQRASNERSEFKIWVKAEVKQQLWLAAPITTVNLLQYAVNCISLMFVGHLGELALASASIATALATVSGYTVLMGMACALDTLCGQAFGAKNYPLVGLFVQQATWIFNGLALLLSLVWLYMASILKFMGQDPQISDGAGVYARYLIPSLFSYATLQPLVKFLQAHNALLPMAIFSTITLCCHVPLCWLMVFKLDLGFRGAAIANGISEWLNVIFLVCYIKLSSTFEKTWKGFHRDAFRELSKFFKLAIPSTIMLCLEAWTFEFVVLLSGLLPHPKLQISAVAICLQTTAILYMLHFGISSALSVRISNELGAKRPTYARGAIGVTLTLAVIEGIVTGVGLYLVRNIWPQLYSSDIEVINYVAKIVPVISSMAVVDAFQGTLNGVARGCGWQLLAACINLVAFYGVGLPTSAVLAFVFGMNGRGLWIGIIMGLITQATIVGTFAFNTNWDKQAQRVRERIRRDILPTIDEDDEEEQ